MLKRFLVLLIALLAAGRLLGMAYAVVQADEHQPSDEYVAAGPAEAGQLTVEHDLALVSFEKLFRGTIISGDAAAFSFEIVNQGLSPDTATWSIVSDNTTPGPADDIVIATGSSPLPSGFSIRSGPGGLPWDTTGARTSDHAVTLSVDPVPQEATTENNSGAVTVTIVEQPVHDVAVTGIAATSGDGVTPIGTADVPSWSVVNVNVSLLNRGSVIDTLSLSLIDDTDGRAIAGLDLTLDAGEDLLLGLPWDTSGSSSGDHTLKVTATLSGDADTSDNSLSTSVPVRVIQAGLAISNVDAILSLPLEPASIPTEAVPASGRFQVGVDQTLDVTLVSTAVSTQAMSNTIRFFYGVDKTFELGLVPTTIPTEREARTAGFFYGVDKTFELGLTSTTVTTQRAAVTSRFDIGVDVTLELAYQAVEIPTGATAATIEFFQGVDQRLTLGFGAGPFVPFATIRSGSEVGLRERDDSTGAYIQVGGEVHFVRPDGSFEFPAAPGTYPIRIMAPGYLPVNVVLPGGSDVGLAPGDVLTIPGLTMVFGDANGDGVIDVRNLAVGASNLTEASQDVQVTPE